MTDYDLSALGPRNFEHLTQALARASLGNAVVAYGDGRDGGRDAVFRGEVNQPHRTRPGNWNGYGVIQAKHFQFPTGLTSQVKEFEQRVKSEMRAWKLKSELPNDEKKPEIPNYLIFVTNLRLSAVELTGGRDALHKVAADIGDTFGLIEAEFWDYRQLCTMIDVHEGVRHAYAALITSGDILSSLHITHAHEPSVLAMAAELLGGTAAQIVSNQWLRLDDVGFDEIDTLRTERRLSLGRTGTDLPASVTYPNTISSSRAGAIETVLRLASEPLRPSLSTSNNLGAVITGGPGQGKSTVIDFIAHIYRAAALDDDSASRIGPLGKRAYDDTQRRMETLQLRPAIRRWPIHIELSKIADEYSNEVKAEAQPALEDIIARRYKRVHQFGSIWTWLNTWPFILLLDGLDEVPESGQRKNLTDAIAAFIASARARDCDFFIVATTRPQGYNQDFDNAFPPISINLENLALTEALDQARTIVEERLATKPAMLAKTMQRLETAAADPVSKVLFTTPLQVTIMCSIAEREQPMPGTRHELFETYYETIYAREQAKNHLAAILVGNQPEVNYLHEEVALQLQIAEEQGIQSQASMPRDEVRKIALSRLAATPNASRDANKLAALIVNAATDRIVLLVTVPDGLGYEVRSLQEYMAARSIVSGADEDVLTRLRLVLPTAHWRNTWLLAAGRILSERPRLAMGILGLLDAANAESLVSASLLPGALVALDLLSDNVGQSSDMLRYGLLLQALRLLSTPPGPHLALLANEIVRMSSDPLAFGLLVREVRSKPIDAGSSAELLLRQLLRIAGPAQQLAERLLNSRDAMTTTKERRSSTTVGKIVHRAIRDTGFAQAVTDAIWNVIEPIRDWQISLPPTEVKPGRLPRFEIPLASVEALRVEIGRSGRSVADAFASLMESLPATEMEAKILFRSILGSLTSAEPRGAQLLEMPRAVEG